MEKEYLSVGFYTDNLGRFILKIGTTNDLERRRKEHNRNYRRAKTYTMADGCEFRYLWYKPLSKYNTLRYEDRNRAEWKNLGIGEFIRNDRFLVTSHIQSVPIKIRKIYEVALG